MNNEYLVSCHMTMTMFSFANIFKFYLNVSLVIICFINSYFVIAKLLNPSLPTQTHYELQLNDITFPLAFHLCLFNSANSKIYEDMGYKGYTNITNFYMYVNVNAS